MPMWKQELPRARNLSRSHSVIKAFLEDRDRILLYKVTYMLAPKIIRRSGSAWAALRLRLCRFVTKLSAMLGANFIYCFKAVRYVNAPQN